MSNDQIIDEWLGNQRSEHTREAYAADINKALAFLEDKPLAEVTLRDLQRYAAFLDTQARNKLGNPYADKTKQRFIIAVKSLFSFASDMGHITANPAKRLPIPRCAARDLRMRFSPHRKMAAKCHGSRYSASSRRPLRKPV